MGGVPGTDYFPLARNLDLDNHDVLNVGTISGVDLDLSGTLTVDTINEHTGAAGVTIEGMVVATDAATLTFPDNAEIHGAGTAKSLKLTANPGATITLYGNTHATHSGELELNSGGAGNAHLRFYTAITERLRIDGATGNVDIYQCLTVDTIDEHTGAAGVTIDGVLVKDNGIDIPGTLTVDTINEHTGNAGVTIDGVQMINGRCAPTNQDTYIEHEAPGYLVLYGSSGLKVNGHFYTDLKINSAYALEVNVIKEYGLGGTGVTIDGVLLKDSNIVMAEDTWIGITGPAERFVFDGTGGLITVTAAHLRLDSTNQVQWNTATENISSAAAGHLDIAAATSIDFNSPAGVVPDNFTLGLSGGGHIEWDDQATDEINFISCRVGIGTNAPATSLHVQDTDATIPNWPAATGIAIEDTSSVWLTFGTTAGANIEQGIAWCDTTDNYRSSIIYNPSLATIRFYVNNSVCGYLGATYMLMAGTNPIQFNDADVNISSPADSIGALQADGYWRVGAGTTNHGLAANGDFLVSGVLEVDSILWADSNMVCGHATLPTLYFAQTATLRCAIRADFTNDQLLFLVDNNVDRQIIFSHYNNRARNFDHADQGNMRVYFHTQLDPNVTNNEWGGVYHDRTGFVIESGANVGVGTVPATIDNYISIRPRGTEHARFLGTGVTQIGTPGTDYLSVEADGSQEWLGAATMWDDANLGAIILERGAAAPDIVNIAASTIRVPAFDGNATTEQLSGTLEIPHSWKEGSTVTPHVHWMPTTANAGNVRWQFEYEVLSPGDTAGAGTTIAVTIAASGTAWEELRTDFPAITMAGKVTGTQISFRLFRDPTDGADTYGDDAAALTFGIHFEMDRPGSRQIATK